MSGKSIGSFEKLNFISTDPAEWENNNAFLIAEERVKSMKVVNDHAERGVALVQGYNKLLTKMKSSFSFCCKSIDSDILTATKAY